MFSPMVASLVRDQTGFEMISAMRKIKFGAPIQNRTVLNGLQNRCITTML